MENLSVNVVALLIFLELATIAVLILVLGQLETALRLRVRRSTTVTLEKFGKVWMSSVQKCCPGCGKELKYAIDETSETPVYSSDTGLLVETRYTGFVACPSLVENPLALLRPQGEHTLREVTVTQPNKAVTDQSDE